MAKRIKFANDAERKARKAVLDKLRHSTAEFKAKANADRRTPEHRSKKNAKRKSDLRAKAAAEGREVRKARLTPEERVVANKKKWQKWKNKNLEKYRKADNERHKKIVAARAIASGRKPGVIGKIRVLTDEQRIARARACSIRYGRNNAEKMKQLNHNYYLANPEKYAEKARNRRARIMKAKGTHTTKDIKQLSSKQNGLCAWCYKELGDSKTHIDHWIPLIKGGTNDPNNLRLLHKTCNLRKGTKDPRDLDLAA